MSEPTHTMGIRTTADSKAEGRLKVDVVGSRKRKRKVLKKILNKKY